MLRGPGRGPPFRYLRLPESRGADLGGHQGAATLPCPVGGDAPKRHSREQAQASVTPEMLSGVTLKSIPANRKKR